MGTQLDTPRRVVFRVQPSRVLSLTYPRRPLRDEIIIRHQNHVDASIVPVRLRAPSNARVSLHVCHRAPFRAAPLHQQPRVDGDPEVSKSLDGRDANLRVMVARAEFTLQARGVRVAVVQEERVRAVGGDGGIG